MATATRQHETRIETANGAVAVSQYWVDGPDGAAVQTWGFTNIEYRPASEGIECGVEVLTRGHADVFMGRDVVAFAEKMTLGGRKVPARIGLADRPGLQSLAEAAARELARIEAENEATAPPVVEWTAPAGYVRIDEVKRLWADGDVLYSCRHDGLKLDSLAILKARHAVSDDESEIWVHADDLAAIIAGPKAAAKAKAVEAEAEAVALADKAAEAARTGQPVEIGRRVESVDRVESSADLVVCYVGPDGCTFERRVPAH